MEEFSPGMGIKPKEVQRPDLQPEWREPGFPSTCFSLLILLLLLLLDSYLDPADIQGL